MAGRGGTLGIERWSAKYEHVLVIRGAIDQAGAERIERAVLDLCAGGARAIEVDLSRIDSIDHHGIEAILAAKAVCRDHGAEFRAVPPQATARRLSGPDRGGAEERAAASR